VSECTCNGKGLGHSRECEAFDESMMELKPLEHFVMSLSAKITAAFSTLEHLGYTYHGGDLWKPPIGPNPFEPGGKYHRPAIVPAPVPGVERYDVILPNGSTWPLSAERAAEYADDGCDDAWQVMRAAAARRKACWCETCRPITLTDMRMVLCPDCGNKRCPRATSHENACTGSNEVGQKGSSWEHVRPFENCQFRECDLPGQCREEGACHHPTAGPRAIPIEQRNCQNGNEACLAGQRDGVVCPADSCDIDDGVRKA
jgi:hypothetical protein